MILSELLKTLPLSPNPGDPDFIQVVFTLPSGQKLSRAFSLKNTINDLKNFVRVQKLEELGNINVPTNFVLVSDFPRTVWPDDTVLEQTPCRKRQLFRVEEN